MIIRVARVRQSLAGLRQGATDAPQKPGSRGRTVAVRAGTIGELDGIDLPVAVTSQAKGASPTPSRQRGVELVTRVQAERVGSRTEQSGPEGDVIVWQRPNKPRGMTGEQYRSNPKSLTMRQVSVDARDQNNRAEQFKVVTTILDASIGVKQIGALYQRRWDGEVDRRSIKSTMKMDVLRCKMPEMVRKEIWVHLLAYNLLRTVMAIAARENGLEPREVCFQGAKQVIAAFAPKLEAARPDDRPRLIDTLLRVIAYHRVGDRPGRWKPQAQRRRPKPSARPTQPRAIAKLEHNRSKWS